MQENHEKEQRGQYSILVVVVGGGFFFFFFSKKAETKYYYLHYMPVLLYERKRPILSGHDGWILTALKANHGKVVIHLDYAQRQPINELFSIKSVKQN